MQQIASWRSEQGSRAWLTALLAAMDKAEMARLDREPCEPALLEQLHCQLSNPVSFGPLQYPYSLRH